MRRSFAAGCAILILLGLLHLSGHHSMLTSSGDSEDERRMLELMRAPQDMGAGFVRSTMDIVAGFSLGLSVFSVGLGLLGLVILRQGASPQLLRAVATVYAGIFGVMTGLVPIQVGSEAITGPGGALLGAAGIAVAFAAVVIVLAIVAAIIYGLGWLFVGLAIFIPVVIVIAVSPALAPVILLILAIWGIFRKKPGKAAAPRMEPAMQPSAPPSPSGPSTPSASPPPPPPPIPRDDPPAG